MSWHFGSLNLVGRFWILRQFEQEQRLLLLKRLKLKLFWDGNPSWNLPNIHRYHDVWTFYVSCACCVVSLSSTKLQFRYHRFMRHWRRSRCLQNPLPTTNPPEGFWRYTHAYVRDNCLSRQKGFVIFGLNIWINTVGQWVCQCTFMAIHNEWFWVSCFFVLWHITHTSVCVCEMLEANRRRLIFIFLPSHLRIAQLAKLCS